MKLTVVNGKAHLILFSTREIAKLEEIRYSYGDKDLPWRKKVIPVFGSFYTETLPSPLYQVICIGKLFTSKIQWTVKLDLKVHYEMSSYVALKIKQLK